MSAVGVHDTCERSASSDLWRRTLDKIATAFGRIAYLSSLRNANTGRYEHFGLAQVFGPDQAESTLRLSHEEVFRKWLDLTLLEKKTELRQYFASLDETIDSVVDGWLKLEPYRAMAPETARDHEKEHFSSDVALVLETIRREDGRPVPASDR